MSPEATVGVYRFICVVGLSILTARVEMDGFNEFVLSSTIFKKHQVVDAYILSQYASFFKIFTLK